MCLSHIPQCTTLNRNVHISVPKWYIVGCGTGALWDLWDLYSNWLSESPFTCRVTIFNPLRPRQNVCHFADDSFKCIFLNENVWISIEISFKFVPKYPIDTIPSLVQIKAWRRPGDKPLSESMTVRLLTHICITQPQWVNGNTRDNLILTWFYNVWEHCPCVLQFIFRISKHYFILFVLNLEKQHTTINKHQWFRLIKYLLHLVNKKKAKGIKISFAPEIKHRFCESPRTIFNSYEVKIS